MNGPDIIASVIFDLERQLHHRQSELPASLPATSPWLATALLQKSVRRGRTDLALAAAALLLQAAPDRLWRRLAIIAVEDVGLGDLDAVYLTVVAGAQRRRLAKRYHRWHLVSLIVMRLSEAMKCRCTDDLHVVSEDCPEWGDHRLELADLPFGDLLDVVAGSDPIERRAIALRYAMGTELVAVTSDLARRRGHPQAMFEFLCERGLPHTLVEISREAYRQTGEVICAFLPLLWSAFEGSEVTTRSDQFPPETMISRIPSWALDKFTREGRAAMAQFLAGGSTTSQWLRSHIAIRDRMSMLGHALFRVESGLVKDRIIWPDSVSLRRQADWNSFVVEPKEVVTLLDLLRADIDLLNEERANVL